MKKIRLTKNSYPGKLIVFEGTDGSGKTTQINKTFNYLKEKYPNKKIVLIKQPTDRVRKSEMFTTMMFNENHNQINYRAVQLLTLSDRLQQNYDTIIPLLKDGAIILCDRYIYTSIANMEGRNYKKEKWFFEAIKEIIKPNISFLIYIDSDIAIARIKQRVEEKNRYFDEQLLHKVSKIFKKIRRKANFKIIYTNKNIEETFIKIKKELDKYV